MTNLNVYNLGDSVTVPGDGHAPIRAFDIPATLRSGLMRAIFVGNGLITDFSGRTEVATQVGSPTRIPGNGYTCDQTNYFDSGRFDNLSISMAIIAKRNTTGATGYAGNLLINTSVDVRGVGFFSANAGTTMAFVGGRSGLVASAASVASTLDSWGAYLGRTATGSDTKINNLTAGTSAINATGTGTTRVANTDNLRIGAVVETDYPGAADIALLMVWDRYLSDGEASTLDTWITQYGADLGLSI